MRKRKKNLPFATVSYLTVSCFISSMTAIIPVYNWKQHRRRIKIGRQEYGVICFLRVKSFEKKSLIKSRLFYWCFMLALCVLCSMHPLKKSFKIRLFYLFSHLLNSVTLFSQNILSHSCDNLTSKCPSTYYLATKCPSLVFLSTFDITGIVEECLFFDQMQTPDFCIS